jgi:DNA-binding NarL/FixJ family response regulator
MTRLVIADDSVLFRAAAVRLLADAGFDVVAQAGCADDLLRKVRAHEPDVAIVDIRMPPHHSDDGLQAACTIRSELPHVGVLVLSQHVEPQYARELLERGAEGVGYLLKDRVTDVERFTDAIRTLACGGSVLDPAVIAQMLARRPASELDGLSPREREVLAQIAGGATNRAIARTLFLSERAVERHVTAIFDALGLAASRQVHRRVLAVLAHVRCAGSLT